MNILIDLRWMVPGKHGGMEQAVFELIAAISDVNREDRFYLYCPRLSFEEWAFPRNFQVFPIFSDQCVLIPEASVFELDAFSSKSQPLNRIGVVPKGEADVSQVRIIEIDLVHSSGGYIEPELLGYPSVLTVHDFQHLHFPDFFEASEREARDLRNRTSLDRAKRVICVSQFTKDDLCRHYAVPPEKVEVVWNIPSGHARLGLSQAFIAKTLRKLSVKGDYLLYPAHPWPHKNHERLIEAFKIVRERYSGELQLVFTGAPFEEGHPALTAIADFGLQDSVRHLGFRTPLEYSCLLRGAKALVYPSLFEGFGLPIVEALLAGTPIACSNIGPLREVGGEAVLFFNPQDPDDMAEKMLLLLEDETTRKDLDAKAITQRELFSPESIARETWAVFREAAGAAQMHAGESVGSDSISGSSLSYELGRHYGRLSDETFEKGRSFRGAFYLLKAAFGSPRLAWRRGRARFSLPKETPPFVGRYPDGWIGPVFRDFLFRPQGATALEIRLERPFPETGSEALVNCSFAGGKGVEILIEPGGAVVVTLELPSSSGELLALEITCDQSFVPKALRHSEDSRELSLKLNSIRWLSQS